MGDILPPVLVPGLHLGVCQAQFGRQLHPVLDREIFLSLEAGLQGLQLVVGEGSPRLPLLPLSGRFSAGAVGRVLIVCKQSIRDLRSDKTILENINQYNASLMVNFRSFKDPCPASLGP